MGFMHTLTMLGRDIKLAHSVFALPFALLATFLAAGGRPGWIALGLILWCMFFARTFAMLANRYVDRNLDAANPRTADRALPSGRLRSGDVRAGMIVSGAALLGGAVMFGVLDANWWPTLLTPFVLIGLGVYGLAKRYTLLCHFMLGFALAISPVCAALAIRPAVLGDTTTWWLGGFVLLWVAGFDIIYALQDIDFDREAGLRSIPAALGRPGALAAAKGCHVAALAMLVLMHRSSWMLGDLFYAGMVVVGVLLVLEHLAASRGRFTMAFFTANGVISCVIGALGIADVLRHAAG